MIWYTSILILSALAGGLFHLFFSKPDEKLFKFSLAFAGAYLFSITLVHIIPGLFLNVKNESSGIEIGIFILLGYLLQQVLEYFTAGAEHGHVHVHGSQHNHTLLLPVSVLIGLTIHALMEGSLLTHSIHINGQPKSALLLGGIVLHKVPAAFALVSVLACSIGDKRKLFFFLALFAIASPIGLIGGDYLVSNGLLAPESLKMVYAMVAGGFLQISTTIVFESSPGHEFDIRKLLAAVTGAVVAIGASYMS